MWREARTDAEDGVDMWAVLAGGSWREELSIQALESHCSSSNTGSSTESLCGFSDFTFSCLNFLFCKMRIAVIPAQTCVRAQHSEQSLDCSEPSVNINYSFSYWNPP